VNPPESSSKRKGAAAAMRSSSSNPPSARVDFSKRPARASHRQLTVHGRASHAGSRPRKASTPSTNWRGSSHASKKWNDLRRGRNHQRSLVEGGSRTNVIPEHAAPLSIYALFAFPICAAWNESFTLFVPFTAAPGLKISGGFDRPPLERKMSATLFARAKSLAAQMGLSVGECAVGGGSDGNFTAALDVPTLDGLGAVGDGAHSANEHILVNTMPVRAALWPHCLPQLDLISGITSAP